MENNDNVVINLRIELTKRQYEILHRWENMTEWLTMKAEQEIYESLKKMVSPPAL